MGTTGATRSASYRHKTDIGWSGPLTIDNLTADQLARLEAGTADNLRGVLREQFPWLGRGGRIAGITYED